MKKGCRTGAVLLVLCEIFAACSHGTSDATGGDGNSQVTIAKLSGVTFDFSGAKAIAQLDASSARAATDDLDEYVKILADGSMENFITLEDNCTLANITSIYCSSVTNDVFVLFDSTSSFLPMVEVTGTDEYGNTYSNWQEQHLGRLICIHSDGTIADILKKDSDLDSYDYWQNYMELQSSDWLFDGSGNLYFVAGAWDTGYVIYQFNPRTDELTQMVAAVEGTNYSKIQLTSDGTYILAEGSTSGHFLRAIPVSNPNSYVNLFFSSDGGLYDWVYDNNSGIIYFSAVRGDNTGLFTATKAGGFKDVKFISFGFDNLSYIKFDAFLEGTISSSELMQQIRKATCGREIELHLSDFPDGYCDNNGYWAYLEFDTDLTDAQALDWLKEDSERVESLKAYCSYRGTYGFLSNCIYDKKTGEKGLEQLCFSYCGGPEFIGDFSTTSSGVYGRVWESDALYIIHIADAKGNIIEDVTKITFPANGKQVNYNIEYGGRLYMKYSLIGSSNEELGYHHIYSVNLSNGEIINHFDNVANRNSLEVVSYSVGGDKLYFSAVRGTTVENHVVDVNTNECNPLDVSRKMVAVYAL